MAKTSLRNASIACLVIWAAIWLLFLLMRLSPLDIRGIPGAGRFMPIALAVAAFFGQVFLFLITRWLYAEGATGGE